MSRRANDLKGLARLTDVAFAADQAKMVALRRKEEELRALLVDLDRPRHDPTTPIEEDAALRAGADLNWQLWVDNRRSAINTDLARVLVAQIEARRSLSLSFGRNAAAERLRDTAIAAAREEAEKRSERNR